MVICVNIRLVRPDGMDGIGWFSYEIIKRWVVAHPQHQFVLLSDKSSVKKMITGANVRHKLIFPPARKIFLIKLWHKVARSFVNRLKPDIYISMDGQFASPVKAPVLTVIHDLNFHHHPEWMPKHIADFYNLSMPECAKRANRIATVSEYSKKDISKSYGVATQKIDVVYNGFNEELLKVIPKKHSDDSYFLFVGIQVPRKNIVGLIKSFTSFKEKYKTSHQLKLAGHDYLWNQEMKSALEESSVKHEIHLLGRKTFEDLKSLYAGAEALLYIPLFEGFGIPVLEGFAAGLPVICSNTTSIPEVSGDATLSFSPTDYFGIADAMHEVSSNEEKRSELIKKGKKQLEHFNWENTSSALWKSVCKTLNKGDA